LALIQALNMIPGQPLLAGVYGLTEGIHYNYSTYGHTLVISLAQPAREDIHAINHNDAAFALVVRDDIVFMLAKIGHRPWSASHYNWWINPPHLRPDPLTDLQATDPAIALQTCLTDVSTGLVAAARTFMLSREFGKSLLKAAADQIRKGLDAWHQLGVAREILGRSPDQAWMLEEAACVEFCQADGKENSPAAREAELGRTPKRRFALVH
jgi:hypothetical protein